MIFNFEFFLTFLVLVSGGIVLADFLLKVCRRPKAVAANDPRMEATPVESVKKTFILVDYARSFFPVLLVVLLLRSFVAEPFRIPSGSLEPTLQVGDFILVNKFAYGLRLPVLGTQLLTNGQPARGDIVVFRYPYNRSIYLVKRMVGLPGDHLTYIDKVLYINGEKESQHVLAKGVEEGSSSFPRTRNSENLSGVNHQIFLRPDVPGDNFYDIEVPPGHYFVMGDNRDESNDSRSWGFVPQENLVGHAGLIWLSVDLDHWQMRWQRIGLRV